MTGPESRPESFGDAYAHEQLRRSRQPLRRFVKSFYLRSLLNHVRGATLDYGCGAGQLLARLPAGSLGLESNPALVAALTQAGLPVRQWTHGPEGFDLPGLGDRRFETLVISHVLEHLPEPTPALRRLLLAAKRLGVSRALVVVPGELGYASDATHRSFIDSAWLQIQGWQGLAGYRLMPPRFFPFPWEAAGRRFVYNEMQLVFELDTTGCSA
jgi:SAM-dependent methyltransferase